ncbi:hypothetical protein AOLI_G00248810 [Acnodon oligacanthus]
MEFWHVLAQTLLAPGRIFGPFSSSLPRHSRCGCVCEPAQRDKQIPTEPRGIRKSGCTMSSRHKCSQMEAMNCLSAGCILSDALGEEVCLLHSFAPEEEGKRRSEGQPSREVNATSTVNRHKPVSHSMFS